jgi:hypothetical protein
MSHTVSWTSLQPAGWRQYGTVVGRVHKIVMSTGTTKSECGKRRHHFTEQKTTSSSSSYSLIHLSEIDRTEEGFCLRILSGENKAINISHKTIPFTKYYYNYHIKDGTSGACSTHEIRNAYKIAAGTPKRKRPLGRPRHRWKDIKIGLGKIKFEGVNQTRRAQNTNKRWAVVNWVTNILVP